MSHIIQNFDAAASVGLRATFNAEGQHLDTFTTSIDGQTLDVGLKASIDPGFTPETPGM